MKENFDEIKLVALVTPTGDSGRKEAGPIR